MPFVCPGRLSLDHDLRSCAMPMFFGAFKSNSNAFSHLDSILVILDQNILCAAGPRKGHPCGQGILYLQGQPQSLLVAFVQPSASQLTGAVYRPKWACLTISYIGGHVGCETIDDLGIMLESKTASSDSESPRGPGVRLQGF